MASSTSTLPPDLFDQTTLVSLTATVVILAVAYGASQRLLSSTTPNSLRILFIWHFFDFLVHFNIEGSLLYHCFFTSIPAASVQDVSSFYPSPYNYLGTTDRIWGPQAGDSFTAKMWMIYARADKRWAGADLTVICLEILTVFVVGPLAVLVCYDIAKRNPRASILMIVIATCELYGDFMTFGPEWLVLNTNLDTSNFMYLWIYLVFFNMLWVVFPLYAIYVSVLDIFDAFTIRTKVLRGKKAS